MLPDFEEFNKDSVSKINDVKDNLDIENLNEDEEKEQMEIFESMLQMGIPKHVNNNLIKDSRAY